MLVQVLIMSCMTSLLSAGYQNPQPYDFGYQVKDPIGGRQHRIESSNGQGAVKGSYGYTDPQGIYRQVNYVADQFGFRAQVKTNEPGTVSQNPAQVDVQSTPIHVQTTSYNGPSGYGYSGSFGVHGQRAYSPASVGDFGGFDQTRRSPGAVSYGSYVNHGTYGGYGGGHTGNYGRGSLTYGRFRSGYGNVKDDYGIAGGYNGYTRGFSGKNGW